MTPTAELLIPEVEELIREGEFSALREALAEVPAADVADIFSALEIKDAAKGFRFLPRDHAAEVFAYLPQEFQESLIAELGAEDSARFVDAMEPDDRAKLIDELPESVARRIIESLSPEKRKQTQAILGYPAGSVGRLMTPEYVRVRPEWSVAYALDHVRRWGKDAETINVVYVIDEQGRLIDDLRLRQLLLAPPNDTIESLMNRSFSTLRADQPQAEAVDMLKRYDRVALPVVDSRGVLLGIVTHDDLADVAEREATEDIQKLGGVSALDAPYIQTGHVEMFKKRGPWLSLLLVGQSITIVVLGGFQDALDKAVVLALFMPLVLSCGGNSGSQAATLITRAMALGEVHPRDWLHIVRRELVTAIMLGATLSALGCLAVFAFSWLGIARTGHAAMLAGAVALAILTNVLWAVVLGSTLPLLLRRAGIDPATASSPMVATIMDASGTLIYLGISILLLTGVLL